MTPRRLARLDYATAGDQTGNQCPQIGRQSRIVPFRTLAPSNGFIEVAIDIVGLRQDMLGEEYLLIDR